MSFSERGISERLARIERRLGLDEDCSNQAPKPMEGLKQQARTALLEHMLVSMIIEMEREFKKTGSPTFSRIRDDLLRLKPDPAHLNMRMRQFFDAETVYGLTRKAS